MAKMSSINPRKWRPFLPLLLVILQLDALAQLGVVGGKVMDAETGDAVPGATILLAKRSAASQPDGGFAFDQVPAGDYPIQITAVGYTPFLDTIQKNASEDVWLEISIDRKLDQIEEVTVVGQSQRNQVKQAPIRAVFIDTRAVSTRAISLTDLMNNSPGIRVRQSGGMGSRPELSINGFQGKSIKYFKDGVPIDHLGEGFNLSSLPVEMLDRVEVFKGVLPASLGADALGGAVNLVTDSQDKSQARAFYEIGSFSTHRLGLMANRKTADARWSYGADVFFNYADNDYKALVGVIDPDTRNVQHKRLPMFHNAYTHLMGEVYSSIINRPWTEELKFSLSGFNLKKEQQHPALMTDPYGALHSKQYTVVPSLRYKHRLFQDRLAIDHYSSYNDLRSQRIDTLRGTYDWYGNWTPSSSVGESRLPSHSDISERQWVSRTHLNYQLSPASRLELNHVFTSVGRDGSDPLGPRMQETQLDVLSLTSTFQKHVFGLSLEQFFFNEKLQNQLMAKYYRYQASGLQNTWLSTQVNESDFRETSGDFWGITEALKYRFSSTSFIRGALELTYRLPDREELFGNNVFLVPNFELTPERSFNANLGYNVHLFDRLTLEANVFYRRTKDMILLVPIQAPNAQYQNQENVQGYGFDLDLSYRISSKYKIIGNATWQDLRLYGISNAQDLWKNQARLRNTPYFFANLSMQADYRNILHTGDGLQGFLHYNYMREFYLETIPKSLEAGGFLGLVGSANLNSNLVIPDQHLLSAGFNYGFTGERLYVGAECRNLLNRDVYDYYRVQRPGRSFHLKLTYKI